MIRDLGLGSRLVGITTFCQRPSDATEAVIIGSLTNPNLELIATLKPSLVLGNKEANRPEALDRLEALGLQVIRLGPSQNLDDIIKDFTQLSELTHRQQFAKDYIRSIKDRLEIIRKTVEGSKRKRVFIEIWPKPLMTVSRKGFIHNVVEMAGGTNLFADAPIAYPQVTFESVIAKKPDVILILTHSLIDESREERYRAFSDFKNTRIQQTDASDLSQPCLSSFLKAAEFFLHVLHSETMVKIENPEQNKQDTTHHDE